MTKQIEIKYAFIRDLLAAHRVLRYARELKQHLRGPNFVATLPMTV